MPEITQSVSLNNDGCRMVVKGLRHYIKTILNSFKVSNREPHTYYIIVENNSKTLKYLKFKPTIKETLKYLEDISKIDGFVKFVGFEMITKLKNKGL